MKQDRKKIRDIQKRFLVNFLDFCEQNQIHDRKDVLSLKLREVLDHPLWKLLELDGKYGGRYISEGVHQLETVLGKRVSRTAGRWPKKLVKEKQKMLADMGFDEHSSLKCQLDHVSERKQLGDALMNKMIKATDIEAFLLGCVMLKSEHKRLRRVRGSFAEPWTKYKNATPPVRVFDRETQKFLF